MIEKVWIRYTHHDETHRRWMVKYWLPDPPGVYIVNPAVESFETWEQARDFAVALVDL